MPTRTQLDIVAAGAHKTSPEHKRFQKLLARIEQARERLAGWHRQLPLFAQAHEAAAAPAIARLMAARREWAFELEQLLMGGRWSRADSRSLSALICELAGALLDDSAEPDDQLKALFNRHAEVDFDRIEQQELDALKDMLERVGGIDLGDKAVASADELMQRARDQMAEQALGFDQAQARRSQRRRPSAAQRRAEEDQRRISQTVREVYRKLASALHPDRITKPAARAMATTQMQRANVAYEAGDLLALLELQLQIEQVDIAHAAGIAAEQVRHFNKVLAEQLREIEDELDERQHAFCATYGLLTEQRLDPNKLGLLLKDEMRELAAHQTELDHTRRLLRGDAAGVKRWLKGWRAEQRAAAFEVPFF